MKSEFPFSELIFLGFDQVGKPRLRFASTWGWINGPIKKSLKSVSDNKIQMTFTLISDW